ncbi:MAG TPA: BatA and WFA domain-containing protein [Tepidisphaeraceae bacterium]|nr:BatA and WFA domain-containing protein [Tepidisphaeraceae bacterium]
MFLNVTMLAGLAGALLPLLLHLLNRARYRNVRWGAMLFLYGSDGSRSRISKVKEYFLLVIRMAMVTALAVAMARPVVGPAGVSQDSPACTMILVDHSASMELSESGPTRLQAAIKAALNVISNLKRGDEAALIQMPDTGNSPHPITTDLQSIATRIEGIQTVSGRADINAALISAATELRRSRAPIKHIVVITDQQASNWRPAGLDTKAWQSMAADSNGRMPGLTVIPIGGEQTSNVSVESVRIVNTPVVRDIAADVEVNVRNYDTIPVANLRLAILEDNRELYATVTNLDSAELKAVHCPIVFASSGPKTITARIVKSGIASDDFANAAIEVIDPIGILVVSGDDSPPSEFQPQNSADFIRLALAPFSASERRGADLANVQVVGMDAWPTLNRDRWHIVILANIPQLTSDQVRQLEQFAYGGGGLIISPGNLTRVDDFNSLLWRDATGLSPAEMETPVAGDGSQSTWLLGLDLSHPVFHYLNAREEPVPRIAVARYFPTGAIQTNSHVLGRFASGSPFLIEQTYGRGKVLLFTLPLNANWSALPMSGFFLSTMQSIARYMCSTIYPDRNLWPGEPINAMIDNAIGLQGTIAGSGSPVFSAPINLIRVGDGYEARFSNPLPPGRYQVSVRTAGGQRDIPFQVRTLRDESDLKNLTAEQWITNQKSMGFERIDSDSQSIAARMAAVRRRRELWLWLLGVVLLLAVIEMALSRVWSKSFEEALE